MKEQDHAQTVRHSLSHNIVIEMASRVGYVVSRFFVPPFILAHVSLEAYGLWSTAFMLVSYIGISTLGMSNVYIKFVADYSARREYNKANSLLSTGLLLTLPTCLAIFGLLWISWPLLLSWLHIAPNLQRDAREVIFSVAGIFLGSIGLSAFRDTLVGAQRSALVQYIWTAGYVLETALIFALVQGGRGIRGLAEAYVARTALEILLSVPVAFRTMRWLRISPHLFSRQAIHTLLSFGGIVQIQSLLAIFLDSVERAIAAPLLGLSATGLLDISQKIPTIGATVPTSFASAFLPAASYLHGGLDENGSRKETLRQLYIKGARYMNLSAGYVCGFVAAVPGALFSVWIGHPYEGAAFLMAIFAVATQAHLLTGPGTSILRGMGRINEEFHYAIPNLIALLLTVPLAWLIQGKWNTIGIGTAVPAATILATAYFLRRANRLMEVSPRHYAKRVLLPGILPYFLGLLFTFPITRLVNGTGRWIGAAWIALGGLAYTFLLAFVVDRFVLERAERTWFRSVSINKLRRVLEVGRRVRVLPGLSFGQNASAQDIAPV